LIVGATVNEHEAISHVPPLVLFPTPPDTTEPMARQAEVELETLLHIPEPINEAIALAVLNSPPEIVEYKLETVFLHPPPIVA
jgi:hypothetical protein